MNRHHVLPRFALPTILACIALGLAACSSPVGGHSTANSITVTGFDEVDIAIWKQVAAKYESSHPGTNVSVTQIPEGAYVAKLDTSISVNSPPDIAYVYGSAQIPNFQPLNQSVYRSHHLPLSNYNVGVLQQGCGKGQTIYCAGGYVGGEVLFYNKQMFQAANQPFPR